MKGVLSMTTYMWKVTSIRSTGLDTSVSTNLFQGKDEAELFIKAMETAGHTSILNKWTWKVEIEK